MKGSAARAILLVFMAAGLMLGLSSSRADASPITFDFGGAIPSGAIIDPLLAPYFSGGDVMTGSYTFESSTPDTSPATLPNRGIYNGTLSAFTINIGAYTWTLATPGANNFIFVDDQTTYDRYQLSVTSLSGPNLGTMTPMSVTLILDDTTGAAFTNTALPLTAPDLTMFDVKIWHIIFDDGTTSPPAVGGSLDSLTPVPEPATMLLLGTGLAGVGLVRRTLRARKG